MKLLTGGKLRPDRFVVVTADGPIGREVVIWPMMAAVPLPGEYHLRLRGALRSPAYYKSGFIGVNWSSPDAEIEAWLRKEKFEADRLPNEMKFGLTKVTLDHVIDIFAEAADVSRVVMTLGGFSGIGTVKTAMNIAGRLAPSIALSSAPGPCEPLGGVRYSGIADAAFTGAIEHAVEREDEVDDLDRPPVDPAARIEAILEAAAQHQGKRLAVGAIDDAKRAANMFAKVVRGADPASLVAFFDTGMRANGKAGIAFLSDEIHVNELGDHRTARYEDLRSVRTHKGKVIIEVASADDIELLVGNDTDAIVAMLTAAIG